MRVGMSDDIGCGDCKITGFNEVCATVCNSGVGRRIMWIDVKRLLKHLLGESQGTPRMAEVKVASTHQIESISFAVVG
jgi:hypothetical protein